MRHPDLKQDGAFFLVSTIIIIPSPELYLFFSSVQVRSDFLSQFIFHQGTRIMTGQRLSRVTTSHWGAFRVNTEGNKIESVSPFEHDPDPSSIPLSLPAAVHHHTRVKRPSIRKGWLEQKDRARSLRGKDSFIELPWDEALDIAASEINRVRNEHSNESIFGGSYGWASAGRFHHALSQVHRFLNTTGGYVSSLASYSTAAAQAIIPHVFGMHFLKLTWEMQNSWPMIADNTQTLVMFGGINPKNSQVSMGGVTHHETNGWFKEFDLRGIRRINISPQITDTPDGAEWIPVRPGSDTAMMLALAYVLENEDLLDREFLTTYTTGYSEFLNYLMGQSDSIAKTPEWAENICGISATVITELARTMAKSRTLITVSWALQRAQNGEHPFWMAATLAAMLGQIGLPGGGIGYGYGAIGGVGVSVKRLGGITLPQGENPVETFIPVARIADMLLNPGQTHDFNGKQYTYPDIRLVYWCGGNPFHHHQDLNRLAKAWQQPETIIVNEPWWTATAKRADIVFPATTPYEREDIGRAAGDSYLFHMPKLIEPVDEARNDYDIFKGLAQKMGLESDFTENRTSDEWIEHLYEGFIAEAKSIDIEVPDLATLKEINWIDLPLRGAKFARVPFADFRSKPIENPLPTPSGKIEIFSQTIAGFGYEECPGYPNWQAPDEWLGSELANKFPLHLVSPQPADKLHSQMECAIADIEGERPAPIEINPVDAADRGIKNNDLILVFNQRGQCRARARLTDRIMAGVVSLPTGAWYDPDSNGIELQGNPNSLTRDRGTSRIGQGCSAHTALVDIKLF
ncbi:MAG: biotin/methionine sulfoxide reductase [Gammaproteobacteria bacterium]